MLLFSGIVSLLFFISTTFVIEQQFDRYYKDRNLAQYYNEKYATQVQDFILEQEISSGDLWKLDEWVRDNRLIYIQIKKDNAWIYPLTPEIGGMYLDKYSIPLFPSDSYYDIQLCDGTVQMFIIGMYSDKAYIVAFVSDIILSFLLFFLLTMFGIRKKIVYINQLSRDIEILEGGNLEYDVHVQGKDEIADLAKGLNAMKDSFKNQIREVEHLTRTNQEMVTELSHDLRTPLTSVLLYAEILQSGKYGNKENQQDYLQKMIRKIQHMKDLSDKLLAYSVCNPEEKVIPLSYLSVRGGLYDELSDMCGYLEKQGIKVKADLHWEEGSILICEEYIIRILDNIASNILKYADALSFVLIWDEYHADEMCITFENTCDCKSGGGEGYSIGIKNVKMMMEEMDGSCMVMQNDKHFRICLRFRYKKEMACL